MTLVTVSQQLTTVSLATDALKLTVKRRGAVDYQTCLTEGYYC